MKKKPITVQYRRKRKGKTNYRKRLRSLLGAKPRLVVRKSLKNIMIQIIEYSEKGDNIRVSACSKELEKKYGWKLSRKNLMAAYLTGLLIGKKAKGKYDGLVADIGLSSSTKGSKLYAAVKGVIDAGINVPCSEDVIPSEDKIKGKIAADYASKLKKENQKNYERVFSGRIKNKIMPEDIQKHFEETKNKIIKIRQTDF